MQAGHLKKKATVNFSRVLNFLLLCSEAGRKVKGTTTTDSVLKQHRRTFMIIFYKSEVVLFSI